MLWQAVEVILLYNKGGVMKMSILVVALVFVCGVCSADIEYTYERVNDDVVKILEIETTTRIGETNITIDNLRKRIINLEEAKTDALQRYNDETTLIEDKILLIESQIDTAKELGVIEPILETIIR